MDDSHQPRRLIDELELRQEEVLQQLDALNLQIESVIRQWTTVPETPAKAA